MEHICGICGRKIESEIEIERGTCYECMMKELEGTWEDRYEDIERDIRGEYI